MNHHRKRPRPTATAVLLLGLAAASACAPGDEEPGRAADDLASDSTSAAGTASGDTAGAAVATIEGLVGPEAVRYDPDQDVYFVSSFGESGDDDRDANGFITRAGPDGAVQSLRFAVGTEAAPLHMPRGLFIGGDTLWAADVDGVHAFDRRTGEALDFVDFTDLEPGFLNDVARGPDGALYVTDTGAGRVYRIGQAGPEIAVEDERTGPPNGITWDPDRGAFLLAPWTPDPAPVRSWSPGSETLADVANLAAGRADGIEVWEGSIVVATQQDSSIHVLPPRGPGARIRVPGRPADIAIDTRRRRVAVPYIALDRVDIFPLPEPGDSAGGGGQDPAR